MAEGGAIDEAPHCPMYFDEGTEGLEHMPSIPLTRQPWLYLNDLGERFCNEDMPYAFVCRAHNAQPRHMKWVFWDGKWETDGPVMGMVACKDFRSPPTAPWERSGATAGCLREGCLPGLCSLRIMPSPWDPRFDEGPVALRQRRAVRSLAPCRYAYSAKSSTKPTR